MSLLFQVSYFKNIIPYEKVKYNVHMENKIRERIQQLTEQLESQVKNREKMIKELKRSDAEISLISSLIIELSRLIEEDHDSPNI